MNRITLSIAGDGSVRAIYDDELAELCGEGDTHIMRVSHVEPTRDAQWNADLSPVGGPLLGPFPLRAEALKAEVDWLNERLFKI